MAISDDLRAVAKFGTPMLNGRTREDFLNAAADEIDRLRYVLAGVRGAIQTGRNEPLVIWKEQIDIALNSESREQG